MVCRREHKLPVDGEWFRVDDRMAFLILPKVEDDSEIPWVWYAPTLAGLPGPEERWMLESFRKKGVAVAGIDVGESYGSPSGRKWFTSLYRELVENRGLSKKPSLLARSRGGLMLYNWAVENPTCVAAIAGIYPVGNLLSFPGLARACAAYNMTEDKLAQVVSDHNPIDRLAPLAAEGVPIHHIHGDCDETVPLEENSALIAERYTKLGGSMTLEIVAGQGHNMWDGWFQSQALVDFVLEKLEK